MIIEEALFNLIFFSSWYLDEWYTKGSIASYIIHFNAFMLFF